MKLQLVSFLKSFFSVIKYPFLILLFSSLLLIPEKKKAVLFEIKKGETLNEISLNLKKEGFIKDRIGFIMLMKILRKEKSFKPGYYVITSSFSVFEIMKKLIKGVSEKVKITIPEGLTIYEIASILYNRGKISPDEFINICNDISFIKSFGIEANSLEGYLYPTTYFFYYGEDPKSVAREMVLTLFKEIEEFRIGIENSNYNIHQILTIASMIQKEAAKEFEMPLISSVIYNRLKKNMKLQMCVTVQYALGKHKTRLLYEDLEIDSPYNTYKISGLPPGPICNPGKSAIMAAIYPAKTDYLYFVSKGDGTHHFSKNLDEHINNKTKRRNK